MAEKIGKSYGVNKNRQVINVAEMWRVSKCRRKRNQKNRQKHIANEKIAAISKSSASNRQMANSKQKSSWQNRGVM
jgi:hypothetical protein